MDLEKRKLEIGIILAAIEQDCAAYRHWPENDAREALEIIDRIERKLDATQRS